MNESSTLQLIKGISNHLQKLGKHFNGTTLFTLFFASFAYVLAKRLNLYMKDEGIAVVISA